jgi:hypothetical protein
LNACQVAPQTLNLGLPRLGQSPQANRGYVRRQSRDRGKLGLDAQAMRLQFGPLGLVCLERRPALGLSKLKTALGAEAREGRASESKRDASPGPPSAARLPGMNGQAGGENVAG